MWRTRALAAITLAGASALLAAAPARAQVSPTPTGGNFASPSADTGVTSPGSQLQFTAGWSESPTNYIDQISITVNLTKPGGSSQPFTGAFPNDPPDHSTHTCIISSPSAGASEPCKAPLVNPIYNGSYVATSKADGCNVAGQCGNWSPAVPSATFTVDIPAAPPTGLTASYDDASRKVRLIWDPYTGPQFVDYLVERSIDGDTPSIIATVGSGAYTDSDTGAGGSYQYVVVTERAGTNGNVPSGPSAIATASVPPPPTPTTTTVAGGGGPSTGPTTTTKLLAPGLKPPSNYTPSKLDLSAFAAALNAAKAKHGGSNDNGGITSASEADNGYKSQLPYGSAPPNTAEDGGSQAASAPLTRASTNGKDNVRTAAAVAGGLLAIVLAMHGMWLRAEVKRASLLEAVEPEPLATSEFRDFWFMSEEGRGGG
jgi:hypothetical protein